MRSTRRRAWSTAADGSAFPVDFAYLVRNNFYVFGIRGEGKSATHRAAALIAQRRYDAKLMHRHTFPLAEVPTAIRYARSASRMRSRSSCRYAKTEPRHRLTNGFGQKSAHRAIQPTY